MAAKNDFHLLPSAWKTDDTSAFRDVYAKAFSNAKEIFVVSAFLTEWPEDLILNPDCTSFSLVVGADFGTTRVAAVNAALAWVPERFRNNVLAFNQKGVSFHPKAILWRAVDGSRYFTVGSSNLTRAAFNRNVEANVTLSLSEDEYSRALVWKNEIEKRSVVITQRWLKLYKEASTRRGSAHSEEEVNEASDSSIFDLELSLETDKDIRLFMPHLEARRKIRAAFDAHSRVPLLALIRKASESKHWTDADNESFYENLLRLWGSNKEARMGGKQWTILGRNTDHQELAKALVSTLDAQDSQRDQVVLLQMAHMKEIGLSTRSAVFTELLCHFYPNHYPLLDKPVHKWRSRVGFDKGVGGSEGEKYIRLACSMRAALYGAGPQRLGIENLAELDVLIWYLVQKLERRKGTS